MTGRWTVVGFLLSVGEMDAPLLRKPLASQAADWLRSAIRQKTWTEILPGERLLCERLGVSRPVLRAALRQLETEGLIACQPNHPRRILVPARPRRRSAPKVVFLVGADEALSPAASNRILHHTVAKLSGQGVATEIRRHPALEHASAGKILSQWTAEESPETRWVLISVIRPVQEWFSRRPHPALIFGTPFPGVKLPSLDADLRAVSRHAAGRFLAAGHRRLALITTHRPRAGDLETEAGFLEACRQRSGDEARPLLLRTHRSPDDLCRLLRRTLRQPGAPTAFLISHAQLALSAFTFLQSLGHRIPQDLMLISRDYEDFLAFIRPVLPHYRYQDSAYAERLVRLIQSLPGSPGAQRVLPRFVPG